MNRGFSPLPKDGGWLLFFVFFLSDCWGAAAFGAEWGAGVGESGVSAAKIMRSKEL